MSSTSFWDLNFLFTDRQQKEFLSQTFNIVHAMDVITTTTAFYGWVDSGPLSQRSAHAEQYAQTETNTNHNPDPNRNRRRCPDPNARI